jgi:acylphosphatase
MLTRGGSGAWGQAGEDSAVGVERAVDGARGQGGRDGDDPAADQVRLTAWVKGQVQGVGFRWWTRCRALEYGLSGSASNLVDGRVEVTAQGPREALERLLEVLAPAAPSPLEPRDRRPGRVDHVAHRWSEPVEGLSGFVER